MGGSLEGGVFITTSSKAEAVPKIDVVRRVAFHFPVVALLRYVVFVASVSNVAGWRTTGTLPTNDRYVFFAGKFCYDYKKGRNAEAGEISVHVRGHVTPEPGLPDATGSFSVGPPCWGPCKTKGKLYLMVFDDEETHWATAKEHWDDQSCDEMLRYSSFSLPISLDDGSFHRATFVHESVRPRFWYFTFAACGVDFIDPVSFEIHATNIQQGFQREFGIDEHGTLQLQFVGLCAWTFLVTYLRRVARRATGAEALRSRPLLRLLIVSAVCSLCSNVFLLLHFSTFAVNGFGVPAMMVAGQGFICLAKSVLTLLQLLTAKGWVFFYAPEEMCRRQMTLFSLVVIIFIAVGCEIHAGYHRNMSTEIHLYEGRPGMIILILNVILFAEAWRSMRETFKHETSEEVRLFYAGVSVASLVYFLSLPTMCIISYALDPWVRAKYVDRAELCSRFLATAVLSCCLRPSHLDAMVNARLEDGLGTLGEPREDSEEAEKLFTSADSDGDKCRRDNGDVDEAQVLDRAVQHDVE